MADLTPQLLRKIAGQFQSGHGTSRIDLYADFDALYTRLLLAEAQAEQARTFRVLLEHAESVGFMDCGTLWPDVRAALADADLAEVARTITIKVGRSIYDACAGGEMRLLGVNRWEVKLTREQARKVALFLEECDLKNRVRGSTLGYYRRKARELRNLLAMPVKA